MSKERLKILLYNAIVVIKEFAGSDLDLKEEIGITDKEYKEIMED